ncbi:cytochrome P450 [Mycobacterium manitobense]|uniref:Steroid C26-monooxygenase n=1 Tax=[Mycobacterium] manitobense TaxID=190147 RepID=A0A9X2Y792_9MYCO|nr:cytochrome P450 [[Mycobacterium] manitobense]MCV7169223.1 cytochrome P450 [[Mycobacterium] manitobense]
MTESPRFPEGEVGIELTEASMALAESPAHRFEIDGQVTWLLTRHNDIRQLLTDTRFSRAAIAKPGNHDSISMMDAPDHGRVRSVVVRAFSARRIKDLRERTEVIAAKLIDEMLRQGPPVDLIEAFCLPLPVTVIGELLGIPEEDRDRFAQWSRDLMSTADPSRVVSAEEDLDRYMKALIEAKRAAPSDDLLGVMIAARDDAHRLDEQEMVDLAAGVLIGGHETTATQLANFTYRLLTYTDLTDSLRNHPEQMPSAIEELLRLTPLGSGVAGTFSQVATEDLTIGGVDVRAGEIVLGASAIANRQPDVFADPEAVKVNRNPNPHIAFGHGAHHCLGAPLARMELDIGLTALLTRLPTLDFAIDPDALSWRTDSVVRGLLSLPVTWCPAIA